MKKKFYIIIIVAIIAVIAIVATFSIGFIDNSGISDSSDWETKELVGLKFKVPHKYENGSVLSGNTVDSVKTENSYKSEDFFISVNDKNWTGENDKLMESTTAISLLYEIHNEEIIVFTENETSIAFFEVNGNKIYMSWSGEEATPDIKAIVASFFELN